MISPCIIINLCTLIMQPASTKTFPHTGSVKTCHLQHTCEFQPPAKQILPQDAPMWANLSASARLSLHRSGVLHMSATQKLSVPANSTTTWWLGSSRFALFGKLVPKFLFLPFKIKVVFHVAGKWGRGSRQAMTVYVHTQNNTGSMQDRPKKEPGLETENLLHEFHWSMDKFE